MNNYLWFLEKSKLDFKQYQYDGVKWAIENELRDRTTVPVRGGFIADEMGLGKTITMLGIIFANYHTKTLIVLPNTLILQWASEISRLTGYNPIIYHGPNKKKITMEDLENAHIVLTSYSTIAIGKGKVSKCMLHNITWYRCVFDEAHHLRNKNSRYAGARKLKTEINWLLSGTPVQNKPKDFNMLCSVLGLPASYYTDKENRADFVLYRTKKEVGIVIPNIELNHKMVAWKSEEERKMSNKIHVMIDNNFDSSQKLRHMQQAQKMCILPSLIKQFSNIKVSSSKMDSVIETILERKGNGSGKLVFCQFYEEIDMIVKKLTEGGITSIANFDGRIKNKSDKIKRINDKFEVLVIQIKTGCEGLNMQKNYSEVYFVSPNWNPSIESQAIARCHRIGQLNPVHVFRFSMNEPNDDEPNDDEPNDDEPNDDEPVQSMYQYILRVQENKHLMIKDIFG